MTNPTNNTAPANTTVNKTSTMDTLKDKATSLVQKVTGKGHTDTTHHNTDSTTVPGHHDNQHEHHKNLDGTTTTKHGDVNPSAFLSSVRFPEGGAGAGTGMAGAAPSHITQPEAVHDPSQPRHNAGIIPTHDANTTANPNVATVDGTHVQHQQHDPLHKNHHGAEAKIAAAGAALAAERAHNLHEHDRQHVGTTNTQERSHGVDEHGRHHKLDDPQHGITSRLSGEAVGGDPSLSGATAMQHPVM